MNGVPFESLVGKTLIAIEGATKESEYITFETSDGETFQM